MYYNYVHILQSQYCLHLVELKLHTLERAYNSILLSFVPNSLTYLTSIKCLLNTNIALLIGYNMEDYVSLMLIAYTPALCKCMLPPSTHRFYLKCLHV